MVSSNFSRHVGPGVAFNWEKKATIWKQPLVKTIIRKPICTIEYSKNHSTFIYTDSLTHGLFCLFPVCFISKEESWWLRKQLLFDEGLWRNDFPSNSWLCLSAFLPCYSACRMCIYRSFLKFMINVQVKLLKKFMVWNISNFGHGKEQCFWYLTIGWRSE